MSTHRRHVSGGGEAHNSLKDRAISSCQFVLFRGSFLSAHKEDPRNYTNFFVHFRELNLTLNPSATRLTA